MTSDMGGGGGGVWGSAPLPSGFFNYLPKSKILSKTGSHMSTQLEETKTYYTEILFSIL